MFKHISKIIFFIIAALALSSCNNNTTTPSTMKLSERVGTYEAIKDQGSFKIKLTFTLDNQGNMTSLKFSDNKEMIPEGYLIHIASPDSTATEFSINNGNSVYMIHFSSDTEGIFYMSSATSEEMLDIPFNKK